MKRAAELISHIFDPLVVCAVLGILIVFRSGLTGPTLTRFLAIFLGSMILPPTLLLAWAVATKRVVNWDVSERKQRVKVLAVFLGLILFDLMLVGLFGNTELFKLFVFFFLWYLGFFAITLFWKISGHVSAITLASLLIIKWYGLAWWPIFLTLPLVGWARIVSRNHSLAQVVAGGLYSWVVILLLP